MGMIYLWYTNLLGTWSRIKQVITLARQIWRMDHPRTMVISYNEEPAIIFSDELSYTDINAFMKAIYSTKTTFSRK